MVSDCMALGDNLRGLQDPRREGWMRRDSVGRFIGCDKNAIDP